MDLGAILLSYVNWQDLALVTALEYAYDHSPKGIKVVVQAFGILAGTEGSADALALSAAARNSHLVAFYASLTAGMAAVTVASWLTFRRDNDRAREGDENQFAVSQCQGHVRCRTRRGFADAAPALHPIDAGRPLSFAVP